MTCLTRPETITCACGAVVKVSTRGPTAWRCLKCSKKASRNHRKQGIPLPARPAHLDDSRELGPERPLRGLTPEEYSEWRARRIEALWQEGELGIEPLAERFGLTQNGVVSVLERAGLWERGKGPVSGSSFRLPAGPPVS